MRAWSHPGRGWTLLALLLAGLVPAAATAADGVPAGQAIFDRDCFACHGDKGQGIAGIAPALAGPLTPVLSQDLGRDYVARVLIYGLSGRIVSQGQTFVGAMPIHAALSDLELAEVANYVAQSLNGMAAPAFKPENFGQARALKPVPTHKDLRALRSQVMP
jgi:mono/diheme cytochrome c family protein